ncbi:hypothetical protein D3C85_1118230 [compost metagenome]
MAPPAVAVAGPVLFTTITGDWLTTVSTAGVFTTGFPGSAGVAVAVLLNVPAKAGSIVPLTVIVILLPEPVGILPLRLMALPVP